MLFLLCGCSGDGYGRYPYVHVLNTMWRMDNINIPVGEAYVIDVRKPYEITFNDDGAVVSVYFLKKGEY